MIPCPGPLLWTRASDETDPVVGLVECCACGFVAVTDAESALDDRHYETSVLLA